jgi:hypothetical protein
MPIAVEPAPLHAAANRTGNTALRGNERVMAFTLSLSIAFGGGLQVAAAKQFVVAGLIVRPSFGL